jgi:hypothetical protein
MSSVADISTVGILEKGCVVYGEALLVGYWLHVVGDQIFTLHYFVKVCKTSVNFSVRAEIWVWGPDQ